NGDFDPFAAAGDDRENSGLGVRDPHIVLKLRHVLLGRPLFRKCPGQHELGLEHRPSTLDDAIEGCPHPPEHWIANSALDILEGLTGITLEPVPIQGLGHDPDLNNKVPREVGWLDLAALLAPEAEEGGFIISHDYPGV